MVWAPLRYEATVFWKVDIEGVLLCSRRQRHMRRKQPAHGHRMAAVPGNRAHEQDLIERELAVCEGAVGESEALLEIDRCQDLSVDDRVGESDHRPLDRRCDCVAERGATIRVPRS